jgi:hypothetical protein
VRISYVLPIRSADDGDLAELTRYLRSLPGWVELIVVDGSPSPVFRLHAEEWGDIATHIPPDPAIHSPMGKVAGVVTGVRAASHERVVIADDDVRYDESGLARAATLLGLADLVRPQNYFDELPWHAQLDTARSLLNRSFGADFPGTMAVRRSTFLAAGGYDGDVIFENLELMRTIRAAGGTVVSPLDLYVARRPPSTEHFLSQRVRQAYDDFAIPARMAGWLAVVPATAALLARGRWRPVAAGAAALVAAAELGRRRARGTSHFPATASLLAPAWVAERGVSAWLALRQRITQGGVPYCDGVVPRSASSMRELRRRFAVVDGGGDGARQPDGLAPGSPEPDQLVGPVAERLPAGRAAAT